MAVDITWAKDKRDITTHNTQTKTFNSEEQAIEWIRTHHFDMDFEMTMGFRMQ